MQDILRDAKHVMNRCVEIAHQAAEQVAVIATDERRGNLRLVIIHTPYGVCRWWTASTEDGINAEVAKIRRRVIKDYTGGNYGCL
jgi:recombinational DNA repair protein RecR